MKKIIDGNAAAAHVAYALSDVAAIYPITPSSNMAELADEWSSQGVKNVFGNTVQVIEMQSEAGAIGAAHGSLLLGAYTTTFTCSQGLLLMIPNMFKIAGEQLPMVMHVTARAVASHALSIFGEHSDVMATRQTGFSFLASSNVQESMDLALVAHLAAMESSMPFVHFFDGFRTSHEIQDIEEITYEQIASVLPKQKIEAFRARAFNPTKPHQQGMAQNPDVFFQAREASNVAHNAVYAHVLNAMETVKNLTGRQYKPFDYYGAPDAERVVVVMGSGAETLKEVVQVLCARGEKVGLVQVHLFRPFRGEALLQAIPQTARIISVLDRTKEAGASGEPLYLDVAAAFANSERKVKLLRGRFGLGGKEFNPSCAAAVYENMNASAPKTEFTVGIHDDVTHLSLDLKPFETQNDVYECKFFGLGSDGTVGANKNSIKIIGELAAKHVQGYFEYDSKKSGSITISHLRMSDKPIQSAYVVQNANFIACHNHRFLGQYDILRGLKQNGIVLLNSPYEGEELSKKLPENFVKTLLNKNAKLYNINANRIAMDAGIKGKINMVMQAAFFLTSNLLPYEDCEQAMIEAVKETYHKKGERVIEANLQALKGAKNGLQEVDLALLFNKEPLQVIPKNFDSEFYNKVMKPIAQLQGNDLPVSAFDPRGIVPSATTKFEKRGIATQIPEWLPENCIQCGICVVACPHACIRPVLAKPEDLKNKPEGFVTKPAMGIPGAEYRIQVSPLDCTGCNICKNVCPAKNKALQMVDIEKNVDVEAKNYEYSEQVKQTQSPFPTSTPKGMQFEKPYFEFSGACAGCGETPYITMVSRLFGENMVIANATGCSSIFGGSFPSCPYSQNCKGEGPTWASNLLEDNAEFGFGMAIAINKRKQNLASKLQNNLHLFSNERLKELVQKFLAHQNSLSNDEANEVKALLSKENTPFAEEILTDHDAFIKKSVWMIGGDGWAYDIGYGGLDHVLSSGVNVNILVLDTEVYSNTGGQSSKATPKGSYAKFAAGGKRTRKKDLGITSIVNRNAYVAQISLGANMGQAISAFKEAEAFDGPSLIIAYSPCINHGVNLAKAQEEMKRAVQSGYWSIYRFNPDIKPSLKLDSGEPVIDYNDFISTQNRFMTIQNQDPEMAKVLFEEAQREAKERRQILLALAKMGEEGGENS